MVRQQQDPVRRRRRSSASSERADDVAVPRSSAATFSSTRPLVPGLVGRLDVQQEEVAVRRATPGTRRAARRSRCRTRRVAPGTSSDLDAGEHAEPAHEVDRRREPAVDAVALGGTRQRRPDALTPQPDLGRDRADRGRRSATIGCDASISAMSFAAAGPVGKTAGLPVRSCGGDALGVAQSRGTTHRWRYSTPGWKRTPSRPPPSAASSAATIGWLCSLVGWPAAKSTIVPVGVERDEVAAVRDLVGAELDAHRRRLDRRAPGVELERVVPEDRHVADVAARAGGRSGITAARPTSPRCARRPGAGIAAASSGVRPVELVERLVGAPVGHEHDVLHERRCVGDGQIQRSGSIPSRHACAASPSSIVSRARTRARRRRVLRSGRLQRRRRLVDHDHAPRRRRRAARRPRRPPAAPTSRAVNIKLTPVAAGSSDPTAMAIRDRATTRCTSPSRSGGSARSATAQLVDEPVLDITVEVGQRQRAGLARPGVLPRRHEALRPLHERRRRHPRRRVHDERPTRVDTGVAPRAARRRPAPGQPQRRRARVRARRHALHRARRRRRRRRPGQRARARAATGSRSTRCSARSCASTRRRRRGRRTRSRPTTRSSARRRACPRSGRTACATRGGSRSTATTGDLWIGDVGQNAWEEIDFAPRRRRRRGVNFGWNRSRARTRSGTVTPPGAVPPIFEYSHDDGNCSVTGGYVYRGIEDPRAARRLPVRRLLRRRRCSALVAQDGKVARTGATCRVRRPGRSRFGEDQDGELYVLSTRRRSPAHRPRLMRATSRVWRTITRRRSRRVTVMPAGMALERPRPRPG